VTRRLNAAERLVRSVTEAEWTGQVIDAAKLYGWRVAHFRAARTNRGWRTPVQADGSGFPDLVLVRERLVVAELKRHGEPVRDDQEAWLDAFAIAGVEAYVWRPVDLDDVLAVLRHRGPPSFRFIRDA
jgi:hypothetical protein